MTERQCEITENPVTLDLSADDAVIEEDNLEFDESSDEEVEESRDSSILSVDVHSHVWRC